MTHDEVRDLLAVHSLDAVGTIEQAEIEAHLAECPRCRGEIDAYRDVAAALGNSVEPVPEGLWSSIASRLPDRPETEVPPMPQLGPERGQPSAGAEPDRDDAADEPIDLAAVRRRRSRFPLGAVAGIGSIAVAAAAVAVVLGIGLIHSDNQLDQANAAAHANAASNTAVSYLETSGHQIVNLTSADDVRLAQFVMVPDGRGYLIKSTLPKLPEDRVYQLWGFIAKQPVSLGILGNAPNASTFDADTWATPSKLAITEEPASGSVTPTGPVVASGQV
ncbi:MAG TPA: anti-sigma factor [Acidimicrobiales bacterium]|jgi:hypothetical protein